MINKRKIINDPVYGFISINDDLLFDIIQHPYFQRLRRIKQLGLTHLVYPGALHTRFHHAIGAMHLMDEAIRVLNQKGHEINEEEQRASLAAILLHDIGHGPFSHALEYSIVEGIRHEELSLLFMQKLNVIFENELDLSISIFTGRYKKRFLHQLVSSQLDMDRLDYLKRDAYFTGVAEGVVGTDRIIKMLNVKDDELVVDLKGIYSIEKFIVARRLMYWQVYLHKTVLVAEQMLMQVLKRARLLVREGNNLFATPSFAMFLNNQFTFDDFKNNTELSDNFSKLDDNDVISSVKVWSENSDPVLSDLCKRLVNRRLFKIELQNNPFSNEYIDGLRQRLIKLFPHYADDYDSYLIHGSTVNNAYDLGHDNIFVLQKNGKLLDVSMASDQLNMFALSKPVVKHFLCYPKELDDLF
jgi:hypothetical protein